MHLLVATELRLYPGLQAKVRYPRPHARICLPIEALEKEGSGGGKGGGERGGGGEEYSAETQAGDLSLPAARLPGAPCITPACGAWLLKSTRSKSSPRLST